MQAIAFFWENYWEEASSNSSGAFQVLCLFHDYRNISVFQRRRDERKSSLAERSNTGT